MKQFVPILFVLIAIPTFGSKKKWTEAENMGFAGPVKSVSATQEIFMQEPRQPDGPTIIYPLSCRECEFDRDGKQIRSGLLDNGHFRGTVKHEIRDEARKLQVEEEIDEKGAVTSRHVYTNGPFGKTQDDFYRNGKLYNSSTLRYDGRGNVIESRTCKPDGTLESHSESTFDDPGNELESTTDGPTVPYWHVIQTYSETGDLESFTSLSRDGSVRLRFRVSGNTMLSFWQQTGDEHTYGSGMCFADDDGTERDCREYNWDGSYATVHYTFTDKTKHNPLKATLFDTEHQVVMEADYEYEVDALGNWTKRTVWVQTRESGHRQLFEKDTRTLTYYADGR
jgi:hypothetical protein